MRFGVGAGGGQAQGREFGGSSSHCVCFMVVRNSSKKRKRARVDLVGHLVKEGNEPYGQTDAIHWTEVSATGFIPERHSLKDSRD